MSSRFLLVSGVLLAAALPAAAQNPDYVLSVSDATGPPLSEISTEVILTNSGPVGGWSFGVCHDTAEITLLGATPSPTLDTVNGGDPPEFLTVGIEPGGATMGTIIYRLV